MAKQSAAQPVTIRTINVPDDCGTISIAPSEFFVLHFTRTINNLQCADPTAFNPPFPTGLHSVGTFSKPMKAVSGTSGRFIGYKTNLPADLCEGMVSNPTHPQATAGHVIHIGSSPLSLSLVQAITEAERSEPALRAAWPNTKLFLKFLLTLPMEEVPTEIKTFLKTLIKDGNKAYKTIGE